MIVDVEIPQKQPLPGFNHGFVPRRIFRRFKVISVNGDDWVLETIPGEDDRLSPTAGVKTIYLKEDK